MACIPSIVILVFVWKAFFNTLTQAAHALQVPWSTKYYGPDGPWQAVIARVGGDGSTDTYRQGNVVDLMPGGEWCSWILISVACSPFHNTPCGQGGFWQPDDSGTKFQPEWRDFAVGIEEPQAGPQYVDQAMTIGAGEQTVYNTSMAAVRRIEVTNPDGSKRGPELGTLSLRADDQMQVFGADGNGAALSAWTYPGGLFNQSVIPSYSYGLHIGSATFKYPSSLVFGGYDKGRVIGPYTTFGNVPPTLLDIGIGVEMGASPFDLTNKTGLLISNTSIPGPLSVVPDPAVPYLHLPGNTCQAIANQMPVSFDNKLNYWIWNTTDPTYKSIVTSPAYLSFVFPPSPGNTANVTIKVPFALLNLTLDTPIVKEPRTYFPCMSFTPNWWDHYRLGRAFLQAAFIGRNWRTHTSWLAQASGPGSSSTGLGLDVHDIQDKDTALGDAHSQNDTAAFARSWEGHWTILSGRPSGSTTPASISSSTSVSASSSSSSVNAATGFSMGAQVVIGLGIACSALDALGTLLLFLHRKRRRVSAEAAATRTIDGGVGELEHKDTMVTAYEMPDAARTPELGGTYMAHELPGAYEKAR